VIDTNIIHTYIVLWKIGKRGVVDLYLFEIIRGLLLLISHVLGIIIHLLIWSGILEQGKGRDAVLQPARSTFIVSILRLSLCSYLYVPHSLSAYWHSLYSYLYIQHSLSAYWHSYCIPTCTFNIPCQHTDTLIVFLPVHSTFLVSILTLSLYFYLYIQHSLSAYWHSHCIPTCTVQVGIQWECQYADNECGTYG
jgi:hypothetical protein